MKTNTEISVQNKLDVVALDGVSFTKNALVISDDAGEPTLARIGQFLATVEGRRAVSEFEQPDLSDVHIVRVAVAGPVAAEDGIGHAEFGLRKGAGQYSVFVRLEETVGHGEVAAFHPDPRAVAVFAGREPLARSDLDRRRAARQHGRGERQRNPGFHRTVSIANLVTAESADGIIVPSMRRR